MDNKQFDELQNYPYPDPAWDYAGPHLEIFRTIKQAQKALAYISDLENAESNKDKALIEMLELTQQHLSSAISLLKS